MALNRVWIRSPNFYQGNNGRQLLVIHSSEGAQTYTDLGNYFANASNEVSSHVGIDDNTRGTIGEYVHRQDSAWTAGSWNLVAVQAELCTPNGASSNWSRDTWLSKETMLANLADWLKEESAATGVPLIGLTESQVGQGKRGVCQHRDLPGQTHTDCGPNFPIGYVLDLANGKSNTPTDEEDDPMQLFLDSNFRAQLVFTNAQADGNHRLRLGCREGATVRLDFAGSSATPTLVLTNNVPAGADIPKDCKSVVIKVDDPATGPTSPISYVVSD